MHIYPFELDFSHERQGKPHAAFFPFIYDGVAHKDFFCCISSRFAGDMKYEKQNPNRQSFSAELKLNHANVFGVCQTHSRLVLEVSADNPPSYEADGMVTHDRNIMLSVTVADCLPVYLLDTQSGAFGIVHSGWKGTRIALAAIKLMNKKWGTKPRDVAAILGPCIDSCCYKVDPQRACDFENEFGVEGVRKERDEYFLDLKAANIKILKDADVLNIAVCKNCTFTDDRLGSFRRQGEGYTRMMALVGKT
ncbi:MAG: polyphenol oxidase family protein [Treponema sp.]|jgi:YfiH family protein|nr:polyphenol oxidase family protein [Treponema sp.]